MRIVLTSLITEDMWNVSICNLLVFVPKFFLNYDIVPHLTAASWGLYLQDTFFADTWWRMLTLYLLLITVHQILIKLKDTICWRYSLEYVPDLFMDRWFDASYKYWCIMTMVWLGICNDCNMMLVLVYLWIAMNTLTLNKKGIFLRITSHAHMHTLLQCLKHL